MMERYGIDSRTAKRAALLGGAALAWMLVLWNMTA